MQGIAVVHKLGVKPIAQTNTQHTTALYVPAGSIDTNLASDIASTSTAEGIQRLGAIRKILAGHLGTRQDRVVDASNSSTCMQ